MYKVSNFSVKLLTSFVICLLAMFVLFTGCRNSKDQVLLPDNSTTNKIKEPAIKSRPTRYFLGWHPTKDGIIINGSSSEIFHLTAPQAAPQQVTYDSVGIEQSQMFEVARSPSGRYEVKVSVIKSRESDSAFSSDVIPTYQVQLTDSKTTANKIVLAEGENIGWKVRGWLPDESAILFTFGKEFFLFNIETREQKMLWNDEANGDPRQFLFSADAKYLFIANFYTNRPVVQKINLDTLETTEIYPAAGPSELTIMIAPSGKSLAVFTKTTATQSYLDAANKLLLFETETGIQTNEFSLPAGNINFNNLNTVASTRQSWSRNGTEIAFNVFSRNDMVAVHSVNAITGQLTDWYSDSQIPAS